MRKSLTIGLFAASIVLPPAAAVQAQSQGGYSLGQVESMYPRMKPVHIEKCDRNGDEVYTRIEMQCVAGIYQAMYLDRD